MSRWFWWWILLVALAVSRWLVGVGTGLTSQEAYFWLLGSRWEWASFAGPGGLPGLVALVGEWFGANPQVLRALGPLWVLVSSLGLWWWGCQLRGPLLGFWLTVFWNVLPVVNGQSLIFGPALAAAAFWIWSLALTWKASHSAGNSGSSWWMAAGLVTALGCLFSYALLLVPLGLALFLLLDGPRWSRLLRRKKAAPVSRKAGPPKVGVPALWLVLLPGAALLGPILWHLSTDWVAFAGQTWRSLFEFGGTKIPPALLQAFTEAGGLNLLLAGLSALLLLTFSLSSREARWFLAAGLGPGVWFLGALWRGDAEITLPLLFALVVPAVWLGSAVTRASEPGKPRILRRGWLLHGTLLALFMAALVSAVRPLRTPPVAEPAWAALGERVERLARIYQPAGGPAVFLISDAADAAAGMGFFLLSRETGPQRDFPPVFVRESQNLASQFGLWPRYDQFLEAPEDRLNPLFLEQQGINPYLGRSAIYIGRENPSALPQTISNGFARVVPLEKITDPSGRVFYLYFCEDYQTAPL